VKKAKLGLLDVKEEAPKELSLLSKEELEAMLIKTKSRGKK